MKFSDSASNHAKRVERKKRAEKEKPATGVITGRIGTRNVVNQTHPSITNFPDIKLSDYYLNHVLN